MNVNYYWKKLKWEKKKYQKVRWPSSGSVWEGITNRKHIQLGSYSLKALRLFLILSFSSSLIHSVIKETAHSLNVHVMLLKLSEWQVRTGKKIYINRIVKLSWPSCGWWVKCGSPDSRIIACLRFLVKKVLKS